MIVGGESGQTVNMSLEEALRYADDECLDLVQMNEKEGVAICKLMNYSKYIYEQRKKGKMNNKSRQELKELRLSDNIAENDLKTKAKSASRMLDGGDKVKVVITYRGRSIAFITRGVEKLDTFEKMIDSKHVIDKQAKIEGNKVYMIISPSSK